MADTTYWMRVVIMRRVVDPTRRTNNEPVETWPDPSPSGHYSAKPVNLNAGEEIRQGVKDGQTFLKLEIKGQKIPVDAFDRVKVVTTGRIYRVVGDAVRQMRTTIISLESVDPGT